MKAGDDQEGIGFDEEKERVGKLLSARSTESLKDGEELPRICSHAPNDVVYFGAEATAKTRDFSLVPILRVDEFSTSCFGKANRPHCGQRCSSSALRVSQVTL